MEKTVMLRPGMFAQLTAETDLATTHNRSGDVPVTTTVEILKNSTVLKRSQSNGITIISTGAVVP